MSLPCQLKINSLQEPAWHKLKKSYQLENQKKEKYENVNFKKIIQQAPIFHDSGSYFVWNIHLEIWRGKQRYFLSSFFYT